MLIKLIINPFQNLLYHLERASESFKDLFSEKYKEKAENLTPINIFMEFARTIGDPSVFSRSLKQRFSELVIPDEIASTVNQIFNSFSAKLTEVLLGAEPSYFAMWRDEIQPKLESFKKTLGSIKDEIVESFKRIETITRIPFRFDQLEIFLVDALSEEYGSYMSEILGLRSLALGIMSTTDALKEIVFSLAKLNLGDIISKDLPEDLVKEEKDINNAIVKLIVNEIQTILTMPLEVKNKVDEYITFFQSDWKNYVQNPEGYHDIGHFFREMLLPRIMGKAPEIMEKEVPVLEEERKAEEEEAKRKAEEEEAKRKAEEEETKRKAEEEETKRKAEEEEAKRKAEEEEAKRKAEEEEAKRKAEEE
ncbi:MAG: hypothetical protein ACFFCD_03965, partial [Promethearchaeota archaeon]